MDLKRPHPYKNYVFIGVRPWLRFKVQVLFDKAAGLEGPEIFVDTSFSADQTLVRALFDDSAIVHYDDAIHFADCAQAVRDGDGGASGHQFVQGVLNQHFGLRIKAGSGFIQHQYRRVLQNGAGNGDALALAAGKFDSSFSHQCFVFQWH